MAVLDAGINRLRDIRRTSGAEERATQIATLALDIQQRVHGWLQKMGSQFEQRLREGARSADPGGCAERRSPRRAGPLVAAPSGGDRQQRGLLRQPSGRRVVDPAAPESGRTPVALSVFLQKVGRGETGVLTLTTYAEVDAFLVHDDESPGEPEPAVVATPTETVTWTYTER